jgi:hypothetical protein
MSTVRILKDGKMYSLSDEEREILLFSLSIRRNVIETGTMTLSAQDAEQMGEETAKAHGATIKALSTDQMKLILTIEALQAKL